MKIKLPSDKEVELFITHYNHLYENPDTYKMPGVHQKHPPTATEAKLVLKGKTTYKGLTFMDDILFKNYAICHPEDQFSKKQGRKIAFARLLNHSGIIFNNVEITLKDLFSKEDRTVLWNRIIKP